mgnify:CR=1 FL=1
MKTLIEFVKKNWLLVSGAALVALVALRGC